MKETYRVVNPYNFIPFEQEPERKTLAAWYSDPAEQLSGWLDVNIFLKTPLIVPQSAPIREEKGHKTYDFYQLDGKPAIPGSSLRGMLRSLYEAASNSCLPFLMDEKPVSQRTPLYAAFHQRGLLEYDKEHAVWRLWSTRAVRNKVRGADVADAKYKQGGKSYKNAERVAFLRFQDAGGYERFRIVDDPKIKPGRNVEYGYLQFSIPVNPKSDYNVAVLTKAGPEPLHSWDAGDDSPYRSLNGSVKDTCKNTVENEKRPVPSTQKALNDAMEAAKETGGFIPVYFFEVERDGKKLYYFSGAAAGRVQQRRKWPDVMGKYSPCDGEKLCPACALFGTAAGAGLKGRLRFSDAQPCHVLKKEKRTLAILSNPRPSAFEFYLRKPVDPNGRKVTYWNFDYYGYRAARTIQYTEADGTTTEKTVERTEYCDLPEATPRGRKLYWHSQPTQRSAEKSNQNATMTAVCPSDPSSGQPDFQSRIYFDRVTKEQLQDLIWVLTLGENTPDSTRWQKLGHAKPLGYGSVKLTVKGCQIRILDNNLEMRLEPLEIPVNPDCSFNVDSTSVQALLKMCDSKTTEGLRVEYPYEQKTGKDGQKKGMPSIFQWFSNNRTNANKLKTLPEPTNHNLTLESCNPQFGHASTQKQPYDGKAFRTDFSKSFSYDKKPSREWTIKVGSTVEAKVLQIQKNGFTVEIPGFGEQGFVHIREIPDCFIRSKEDYVTEGQTVRVKYLGWNYGKHQFSLREADR